jgi:hypothetical protein
LSQLQNQLKNRAKEIEKIQKEQEAANKQYQQAFLMSNISAVMAQRTDLAAEIKKHEKDEET